MQREGVPRFNKCLRMLLIYWLCSDTGCLGPPDLSKQPLEPVLRYKPKRRSDMNVLYRLFGYCKGADNNDNEHFVNSFPVKREDCCIYSK